MTEDGRWTMDDGRRPIEQVWKHGVRNMESGTRNKAQGTRNKEQGTRNKNVEHETKGGSSTGCRWAIPALYFLRSGYLSLPDSGGT